MRTLKAYIAAFEAILSNKDSNCYIMSSIVILKPSLWSCSVKDNF